MFENFPYTDMHQLNLDWIIKVAKDFLDQYTSIQQLISDGETALQNETASGLQQLQTKADNLEALLQAWYDTHSAEIAQQVAQELADALTAIRNTGEEVLQSIPEDYTNLVNQVYQLTVLIADKEYVARNATLPTDTTATLLNHPLKIERTVFIKITNTSAWSGYYQVHLYKDDTLVQSYATILIEPGHEYTWEIKGIAENIGSIWEWCNGNDYTQNTWKLAVSNTNARAGTYDIWTNPKDEPMKDNNIIFVDTTGKNGAFSDPLSAMFYAKSKVSNTTPLTIKIRSGKYVLQTVISRNAILDKGVNMISFSGEDQKNTIIELVNVDSNHNQIMNIGGECFVENLSIYNKHTGTAAVVSGNPYCIHNDSAYPTDKRYATIVRNCTLYSEMYNPIGAGLRDKQIQIYDNVTCYYNRTVQSSTDNGALYVHSQAVSTDVPGGLEIVNCLLIHQGTGTCISLPNVTSGDYVNIPVRFLKNTGWTNGSVGSYMNAANFKLTPDSDLNGFTNTKTYAYPIPE